MMVYIIKYEGDKIKTLFGPISEERASRIIKQFPSNFKIGKVGFFSRVILNLSGVTILPL